MIKLDITLHILLQLMSSHCVVGQTQRSNILYLKMTQVLHHPIVVVSFAFYGQETLTFNTKIYL